MKTVLYAALSRSGGQVIPIDRIGCGILSFLKANGNAGRGASSAPRPAVYGLSEYAPTECGGPDDGKTHQDDHPHIF
jgi:hypothetical protein